MSNKNFLIVYGSLVLVLIAGFGFFIFNEFINPENEIDEEIQEQEQQEVEISEEIPEGMVILIEYKDTVGLVNFVNELNQRDIPSALLVTPEFVEDNCSTIKELTNYGVEIIGSNTESPFWDMPYEEQYERISEIKSRIESCTGKPIKIVGSRFFASDENTVKAAEELNIPYVTARGTMGTKAGVYDVKDYNVKILSVSNIENIEFKYGSLCDYSYWTREGEPEDMRGDLIKTINEYDRFTPVSHTNIGGYLEDWMETWKNFWDNNEIKWVSLDQMMAKSDYEMEFHKIPQNRNSPYTPEMLEHVEEGAETEGNRVKNPCSIEELTGKQNSSSTSTDLYSENEVVMFHNNQGSMCLEAKEFFNDNDIEFKEVLVADEDFGEEREKYFGDHPTSSGVSTSYEYFPFIFTEEKSFSGFNEEIKTSLLNILSQ